ncbi:DUF2795 domain-containing protein [Planomonospora corallina]|uniref:DUF2795 domain-containing protein n=1 Tax=Planomonospora corallina TaxID=1806052 RepID=A0ABV8IE74_9ACTN
MERGSAKHGSRLDEQQKHETEGMTRSGGTTHAEEWKEPEPMPASGEGGLSRSASRPSDREPGAPEGMTYEDVERRGNLAKWISGTGVFPADRDTLLARAEEQGAPDSVIAAVRSLPNATFTNMADVAQALGYGTEELGSVTDKKDQG